MIKIKLLFSIFFLFVLQFSYSSSVSLDDLRFTGCEEVENQTQFDKSNFTQLKFGIIRISPCVALGQAQNMQCYLPDMKLKDIKVEIRQRNLRSNGLMEETLSYRSLRNLINNMPIYIQTGKIRL